MTVEQFVKIPMNLFKTGIVGHYGMSSLMVYYMIKSYIFRDEDTQSLAYQNAKNMYLNGFLAAEISQEKIALSLGLKRQTVNKILQELERLRWIQKRLVSGFMGVSTYVLGIYSVDEMGKKTEHFYLDKFLSVIETSIKKADSYQRDNLGFVSTERLFKLRKKVFKAFDTSPVLTAVFNEWDTKKPFSVYQDAELKKEKAEQNSPLTDGAIFLPKHQTVQHAVRLGTNEGYLDTAHNRERTNRKTNINKSIIRSGKASSKQIIDEKVNLDGDKISEAIKSLESFVDQKKESCAKERKEDISAAAEKNMCAEEAFDLAAQEHMFLVSTGATVQFLKSAVRIDEKDPLAISFGSEYAPSTDTEETEEMGRKRKDVLTQDLVLVEEAPKVIVPKVIKAPKGNSLAPVYDAWLAGFERLMPGIVSPVWGAKEWGQIKLLTKKYNLDIVKNYFEYVLANWQKIRSTNKITTTVPTVGLLCSGFHQQHLPESQKLSTQMTNVESVYDEELEYLRSVS